MFYILLFTAMMVSIYPRMPIPCKHLRKYVENISSKMLMFFTRPVRTTPDFMNGGKSRRGVLDSSPLLWPSFLTLTCPDTTNTVVSNIDASLMIK